jgi:hypothetical protein
VLSSRRNTSELRSPEFDPSSTSMPTLTCIPIRCSHCDHGVRATVGDEVIIAQLARSEWSRQCPHSSEVGQQVWCNGFLMALQEAGLGSAQTPSGSQL